MKIFRVLLIALAICFPFLSQAQTTPTLSLALPSTGQQGWGTLINGNFTAIDTEIAALRSPYQGAWSGNATYRQGAIVSQGGATYISLVASNYNNSPSSSPFQWQPITSQSTVQVAFQGAWSGSFSGGYPLGAMVTHNGYLYASLVAANTATPADAMTTSSWQYIATTVGTQGPQGPQGPTGSQGPTGPQGPTGLTTAATSSSLGGVTLATGQTSSILSKVATTGLYADLNGLPAASVPISGGTMTGPLTLPKLNNTVYVVATIQAAVTAACTTGYGRVVIQSGVSPSDTIGAVTGCPTVAIADERSGVSVIYTTTSTTYVQGGPGVGRQAFGVNPGSSSALAPGMFAIAAPIGGTTGHPYTLYGPTALTNTSNVPWCVGVQATTLDAQNNYGANMSPCIPGTDYPTVASVTAAAAAAAAAQTTANAAVTNSQLSTALGGALSPSSVLTPKINNTIYVLTGTVQSAVTAACVTGNLDVAILAGATPSDFASLASGSITGCPTVAVVDKTTIGATKTYTTSTVGGTYVLGLQGPTVTFYGRNPGAATTQPAATVGHAGPAAAVTTPYVVRDPISLPGGIMYEPAPSTDSDGYNSSTRRAATAADGEGLLYGSAALPQAANLIADYQLLPAECSSGVASAPVDYSGNGNTGSLPTGINLPTCDAQGLVLNGAAGTAPNSGQYFYTAGTTNAKTIMLVYSDPTPAMVPYATPVSPKFPALFGNAAHAGVQFASPNYGYQPEILHNGSPSGIHQMNFEGTHVLIFTCGFTTPTTTPDTVYLDGVAQIRNVNGYSCGLSTGVYLVGGGGIDYAAETFFTGHVYRSAFWSTTLSASDAAKATALARKAAADKGVIFDVPVNASITPQLWAGTNSLTAGPNVTPWTSSISTRIAYTVTNSGISSLGGAISNSMAPYREKSLVAPGASSNVAVNWEFTNDISLLSYTPQQALDHMLGECTQQHLMGYKTILATMISRGSPTVQDTNKNLVNALARAQWSTACDALVDIAADARVGADGAYSNTTYFQNDLTHLVATAQATIIAPMMSHAIDQVTGSAPGNCDPIIVTAATYTSVASDGCKTYNTASNSITDTLPSAIGYTGRVIRRCNASSSGSNTLTIAAPSDLPFNNVSGTTTITVPNNSCKDLRGTIVSASAGGAYWQQIN